MASGAHTPPRVLVVGGGVAALETVLALQALGGDLVEIALLAPDRHFTYRPLEVTEPFGAAPVQRFPLAAIAADRNVRVHRDALARVRTDDRVVETLDDDELGYDALVLALGARPAESVPGTLTFRGSRDAERVRDVVAALRDGRISRLAFVVPTGTTWSLPAYELVLQTAAAVGGAASAAELALVTAEPEPLAAFGPAATRLVTGLLADAGVALHVHAYARELVGGELWLDERSVPADRVVALPRLVGPRPRGVPNDPLGFVPVDDFMRVAGLEHHYAIGDIAALGIKQGGLATQQADVVAAVIAAAAGASVVPEPYRPVLRAQLLTGTGVHYLRHEPDGTSETSTEPLWWPPGKIAGHHLAPYLAGHLDLGGEPAARR